MVRHATAADLPECAALIGRIPLFRAYFTPERALRMLETLFLETRPAHHTLLVEAAPVEEGGDLRGLSWFVDRDQLSRGGYLRLFAVDPAAQGGGVAASLLRATEEAVFAHSAALFLMVNTANEHARRFYVRNGFAEVGVLPDYAAPGQDEVLMVKRRPI